MERTLFQSLLILSTATALSARDPFIFQIDSENEAVEFPFEASFADLVDTLGGSIDTSQPFSLSFDVDGPVVMIKVAQKEGQPPRDYFTPVTPQEKQDLSELVTALANDSKATLLLKMSHLNGFKSRLVHLHPLKFLGIIFTDDKLKVGMKNMDGKDFVWSKFQGETVDSLAKEYKAGNIKQEMINDFASKVGLSSSEITPFINGQKWEKLISYLIGNVKIDKPQGKKYNM